MLQEISPKPQAPSRGPNWKYSIFIIIIILRTKIISDILHQNAENMVQVQFFSSFASMSEVTISDCSMDDGGLMLLLIKVVLLLLHV